MLNFKSILLSYSRAKEVEVDIWKLELSLEV